MKQYQTCTHQSKAQVRKIKAICETRRGLGNIPGSRILMLVRDFKRKTEPVNHFRSVAGKWTIWS